MRTNLEGRFQFLIQGQQEDCERFRSWMDREVRPGSTPPTVEHPHLPLNKMGPQDDAEAFLDLFERSAEAGGWPREQWPVRLIPLLIGVAQAVAQQLPVQNLLVFDDLKRAILQRVGRSPEQHRPRFRSLDLCESGQPFVLAQQLRDSCRKWLLAEGSDVREIIDRVVLEQFIRRLPRKTAVWVQCHRPASLDLAIQLAEHQLVACSRVCESLPTVSLSSSFSSPSPSPTSSPRPVPLPRSHPPGPIRGPPRGRGGGTSLDPAGGLRPQPRGTGFTTAGADPVSFPPLSPRQTLTPLPPTRAVGRPGPACWRCGDPDHFIDRCPVMEVGTMIRVPDAHDQAGRYQIPVSIKGGTYQALVDSGCNQTSIHQSLIQPEALDMSRMVRVRCVHRDVVKYPLMSALIKFRGQNHSVEVAVYPHLRHPLILGTNWLAFTELLGLLCADVSCGKGKQERGAVVRLGEAELGPPGLDPGDPSVIGRQILPERDDFPLEQSQDESLKHAFEQVRTIDGQPLQPARPLTYPYFAILKDRLYRVIQDTQTK
ncbi:uncharacterized protein LOC143722376 [Siphateles boraxobius]|uniref:uncharacterized protein LOC143722376 n=1 Tax=Siphateles boraxobius TaxID=180520 RepID=UPI004063032B